MSLNVEKISNRNNISFLDRFDFTCDIKDKLCFGLDEFGKKLYIDYSHYSKAGLEFFGQKIYKTNWLSTINF